LICRICGCFILFWMGIVLLFFKAVRRSFLYGVILTVWTSWYTHGTPEQILRARASIVLYNRTTVIIPILYSDKLAWTSYPYDRRRWIPFSCFFSTLVTFVSLEKSARSCWCVFRAKTSVVLVCAIIFGCFQIWSTIFIHYVWHNQYDPP